MKRENDTELDEIISKNKNKAVIGLVICIVGIALLLLAVCRTFNLILIGIAIVIFCIGFVFRRTAESNIKSCMKDAAIIPALKSVFDNVTYEADEHIPEYIIRSVDMGFNFRIDKINGSDYVKAVYKGVNIEMSDIQLSVVTETTDSDGDTTKTESTRFKGLWLVCDFHKRFTADLLLKERDGLFDKLSKNTVNTENAAFNKQFIIRSESEHDVFYILTPHMMEYIQAMDKKAGGRTYMRFLKEGKLHLALDTGRDSFEINHISKATVAGLREQFIGEVRYVTDLIDELCLVKTLHAK